MTKENKAIIRVVIHERVEEAWDTLRRMPDRERDLLLRSERGHQWPPMLYTAAEHAAWKPVKMRRPPPTGRQIDRMHEVLDWLLVLAKQERKFFKAVWLMCAERKKVSESARILGCDRETARIWRDKGLDRIAQRFDIHAAA
jgi:hypothetical protein